MIISDRPIGPETFMMKLPSMPTRASCPSSYSIVGAYEIIASINSVVAVCLASDQLSVDKDAAITTLVMCTQGIGKGDGRWRGKGRRKWSRWALCK